MSESDNTVTSNVTATIVDNVGATTTTPEAPTGAGVLSTSTTANVGTVAPTNFTIEALRASEVNKELANLNIENFTTDGQALIKRMLT